ncbi:hypothetical protein MP638_006330 [Amoeboaphelidium occidentale]|nr:hypothetical protein MP638_006330 [Amoeboaphelidium occidentale]
MTSLAGRPLWDLFREALIFIVVFSLYYPAYMKRSYVTAVILTVILIQHAVVLSGSDGFLDETVIKVGAFILALVGAYHMSFPIMFAGTYSFASKFKYDYLHFTESSHKEIFKFVFALLISTVVFLMLLYLSKDRRIQKVYHRLLSIVRRRYTQLPDTETMPAPIPLDVIIQDPAR